MSQVKITFNDGSGDYDFSLVQAESGSNLTNDKDLIIEGNRADGSIVIPGGKKSQRIRVTGILTGDDYEAITALMNTMKTAITTNLATLKLQHYDGGWVEDWSYTVKRVTPVTFADTFRIYSQRYEVTFLVISY